MMFLRSGVTEVGLGGRLSLQERIEVVRMQQKRVANAVWRPGRYQRLVSAKRRLCLNKQLLLTSLRASKDK